MGARSSLVTVMRQADREHWEYAAWGLGFALFGALFPIGVGLVLSYILAQEFGWGQIGAHGELALYAAAMLAPSMHQVLHDPGSTPFTQRRTFGIVGLVLFGLATVVFAGAAAAWSGGVGPLTLDQDRLRTISIVVMALTAIFAFLVTLVDTVRAAPDPAKASRAEQDALAQSVKPPPGDANAG